MCSADIFLALLAVLFPPLAVWVKCGICSADSLINILLCILGYIPGLLHAWYIIAKYPEPAYEYEALPHDREGGRVTYVYVQNHGPARPQQQNKAPRQQDNMNYGTQGGSSQPAAQQQQQQQEQPRQQEQGVTSSGNGEGSSEHQGVPPSYAEVVAGDHKIQSRE